MNYYEIDKQGIQHKLVPEIRKQKFDVEVVIKKQITAEDVEDVIVTSLEGQSVYWLGLDNTGPDWDAKPKKLPVSLYVTQLLLEGKTVKLYDVEDDDEKWELTLDKILKGIGQALSEGIDIEDEADTVMQYALFGELVYG